MGGPWTLPTSSGWRWRPGSTTIQMSSPYVFTLLVDLCVALLFLQKIFLLRGGKMSVLAFLYDSERPVCIETRGFVPAERAEALFLSFCIHGCTERTLTCCRSLKHPSSKFHWDSCFSQIESKHSPGCEVFQEVGHIPARSPNAWCIMMSLKSLKKL